MWYEKINVVYPPFIPNSDFTPGTLVFTHFTSARRRYAPHGVAVKKQKQNLKGNRDGYKKNKK